jgi:hypothetical protein
MISNIILNILHIGDKNENIYKSIKYDKIKFITESSIEHLKDNSFNFLTLYTKRLSNLDNINLENILYIYTYFDSNNEIIKDKNYYKLLDNLYIKYPLNLSFVCNNIHTYPPFKNGLYMEEYFLQYFFLNNPKTKKTYIPILWTNIQTRKDKDIKSLQSNFDDWLKKNENPNGYFTIVQHDDGPRLKLPKNTIKCGACTGDFILPLIYEDRNNTLENKKRKQFHEKNIKCSFIGTYTHSVRNIIKNKFGTKNNYKIQGSTSWSEKVPINKQNNFIDITIDSKFAFAPRGYGRSSFRFFEIFKLGTIPIYVWDDIEWLPYKDDINYEDICISINVKDLNKLDDILNSINEEKYNKMLENYEKIKHKFYLKFMCEYIIKKS